MPAGWYRGEPGGHVVEYSDTLLIFLMKGAMPDKYADRVQLRGALANLDVVCRSHEEDRRQWPGRKGVEQDGDPPRPSHREAAPLPEAEVRMDHSPERRATHRPAGILSALTEQLTRAEQIRHVIERVEAEVAKPSEHLPETIRTKERLSRVQEVLERRTEQSALLLRDVLGTIRLEPRKGDVGRPYYLAETSIDCIALLEKPTGAEAPDGGSNSLRQWRRQE